MVRRLFAACLLLLLVEGTADAARRLAVLYFDNNTKDADLELLKKGMADMLITDLAGVDGLEVVEREKLEAVLSELKLQRSRYFDPKTAVRLGKGTGATHAVTGAFSSVARKIRIDVRLIDIASGKVTATDKVIGKKEAFFELERKLVASFSCALSPSHCKKKPAAAPKTDLGALLSYAKGLDLTDEGKLEEASRALKHAMTKAPELEAARARYLEIMKRLYAAKKTRTSQLSEEETALTSKIESILGERPPLAREVGYRILRGQLALKRIDALFDDLAARGAEPTKKDLARFESLVRAYRDNQLALLARLDRASGPLPDPEIDAQDAKVAVNLGLGDEPGNLDFYSTIQIRRDLGSFLTTGKEPFWGTFRWSKSIGRFYQVKVDSGVRIGGRIEYRTVPRPPMARIHPVFLDEGLRLFDAALADAKKKVTDPEALQRETIQTLDAHAYALFRIGRLEQAIAKWQTVLERYPKYENFADIENKIRAALEGGTP